METAMQGSIKKDVKALRRRDAEVDPMLIFDKRTATPACSRI